MKRIRIKVCGTTSKKDADNAVKLGVDALGFIFFPKSKRNVEPEVAADIIATLPPFIDRVGVFVNEPIAKVVSIAEKCSLSIVQLHGNESAEYCDELSKEIPYCQIFKAFRVGEETKPEEFIQYAVSVDGFLLDTYVKGVEGGTGETFDWSIIESLKLGKPFLLAGGLTPENITDALSTVVPFAVDINSGVEDAPGKKNAQKLAKLVAQVRQFEQENLW